MSFGKSFPFPVMSEESMDYKGGAEYSAAVSYMHRVRVLISHQVTGDNFVSSLVSQGAASFACLVSVPSSMFRKIFVLDEHDGKVSAQQMILPPDFYAADILESAWFRPIVLANKNINEQIKPAYGFDPACWDSGAVVVPRGGIVAFDHWKRLKNNASSSMLKFIAKEDFPAGKIRVEDSTDGGFKFLVYTSPEMLGAIKSPLSNKDHVLSILIHALTAGFEILARDYRDNWDEHPNLVLLSSTLASYDIPRWYEGGFKPEVAATILHPHPLPTESAGD